MRASFIALAAFLATSVFALPLDVADNDLEVHHYGEASQGTVPNPHRYQKRTFTPAQNAHLINLRSWYNHLELRLPTAPYTPDQVRDRRDELRRILQAWVHDPSNAASPDLARNQQVLAELKTPSLAHEDLFTLAMAVEDRSANEAQTKMFLRLVDTWFSLWVREGFVPSRQEEAHLRELRHMAQAWLDAN